MEKLDGVRQGIRIPIGHRRVFSFFLLRFFLGVNFCEQTPGTHLHHTVSMVRLPDPVLLIFLLEYQHRYSGARATSL